MKGFGHIGFRCRGAAASLSVQAVSGLNRAQKIRLITSSETTMKSTVIREPARR